MYYVFSIIYYVRRGPHGRMASLAKCVTLVTLLKYCVNKASQAIQSPRTVPFFLLVSLLDGYSFPNVLVKGIVAFKH